MTYPFEVHIPLLNPNEPYAQLSVLNIAEGQKVSEGDSLAVLETTKASAELLAEHAGYIAGLRAAAGDVLQAGERLCWLAEDAGWQPPTEAEVEEIDLPKELRITEPALALARQAGLDVETLPVGPLITEAVIREMLEGVSGLSLEDAERMYHERSIVVYGGGGHGKSLIDLIRVLGDYDLIGVVDDGLAAGTQVMGLTVLGGGDELPSLVARGASQAANAIGGVGDIMSRVRIFQRIHSSNLTCPTLIHPSAVVESSAKLADGVQVFPHAYVGSESVVGFGAIVNTSAVVSHDCFLEAYANVAPGALLAGGVSVGEGALIGMGVTVNLGVHIGAGARIGNSAVIKQDVPPGAIVRAGSIWPPHSPSQT
jgi:acetyltransferase EpsM